MDNSIWDSESGGSKVLVFGPQYLSFHQGSAEALRSHLLSHQSFAWAWKVLQVLSGYWDGAVSALPSLAALDGKRLLVNLATWLQTGNLDVLHFPLPNIVLTPLVVALHLTQYQKSIAKSDGSGSTDSLPQVSETLGLCTGHLSAAAVSCAEDLSQLEKYGAVSIRIAMLIGALVDSKNASLGEDSRANSFSVVWDSRNDGILEQIMAHFPQVIMISVVLYFYIISEALSVE